MANEDKWEDTEFDQEFEDDNDDEFNRDGNGWEDSDENVTDPFECDPNDITTAGDWGDIDVDENAASEVENEYWRGYYEKTDKHLALKSFLNVIKLIENGGDDNENFKFKSLAEIVILYFNINNNTNNIETANIIKYFNEFLLSSKNVKQNELNRHLRKVLNTVKVNELMYNTLYQLTMETFKEINKQLWFNLGIERCHYYLDKKILKKCAILIEELYDNLTNNGKNDKSQTAKLLQVYAVKIQLTMRLIEDLAIENETERDMNKYNELQISLRELITITQNMVYNINEVDILDNKSMSIIYECWAKVFASNNDWLNSYKYFKEAFILYQQIAHQNTTKCLKYLLISYMILSSFNSADTIATNPFDMDEIKVYQNHNDIFIINYLLNAFECDNISKFNNLLKQHLFNETDPFIVKYLTVVQCRLQGKALINLVGSYDRVKLKWLCNRLGMSMNGLEKLIVKLIIDCELNARLDQVNNILILKEKENKQNAMFSSLTSWLKTVNNLRNTINGRSSQKSTMQSFGARDSFGVDCFHDDDDIYLMDSSFLSWD